VNAADYLGMEQRRPIPWVLALVVFPMLGVAGWILWGALTPSSPDSSFNHGALNAMPYLLAFGAPALATMLVAARRSRLAIGLVLALGAPVVTLGLLALLIGALYAIGCSGSDVCST
jgi:hypothetical protein